MQATQHNKTQCDTTQYSRVQYNTGWGEPEGGDETENPDLGPSLFAIPTIFKNASL